MGTLIKKGVAPKSKTELYYVKNGDLFSAKLKRGGKAGRKVGKKKTAPKKGKAKKQLSLFK